MARKVTTLVPCFGSNRTLAENVGKALSGRHWVGVPFVGGCCELAHIDARSIVASDLHRWIINLAQTMADPVMRRALVRRLDGLLFHPDELKNAQYRMQRRAEAAAERDEIEWGSFEAAVDYFVCAWMGRSAKAGTADEFKGQLPIRFTSSGGDSNTRYRSAVEALDEWGRVFKKCNFHVRDAFDFLREVKDEENHGVYCDPPFPGPGDEYRHTISLAQQRQLAEAVSRFDRCRVVMRFYDVPLIRELYPEPLWTWHTFVGRKQSNADAPEVLLTRN